MRNDVLDRSLLIAGGTRGLYSAHSVVNNFSWKAAAQYARHLMAFSPAQAGEEFLGASKETLSPHKGFLAGNARQEGAFGEHGRNPHP